MKSKVIMGIVLTVLLIGTLSWAFSIRQAEAVEPPATEWNKTYGGADYDYAESIVETSDGGYVLAGYTESFGAGGYDAWLVKVAGPSVVGGVWVPVDKLALLAPYIGLTILLAVAVIIVIHVKKR